MTLTKLTSLQHKCERVWLTYVSVLVLLNGNNIFIVIWCFFQKYLHCVHWFYFSFKPTDKLYWLRYAIYFMPCMFAQRKCSRKAHINLWHSSLFLQTNFFYLINEVCNMLSVYFSSIRWKASLLSDVIYFFVNICSKLLSGD